MKKKPSAELVGYCPELSEQVFRPMLELHEEAKDFMERSRALGRDVSRSFESLKSSPQDPFWRRVVVRSTFVFLEACTFGFKRLALHQSAIYEVEFSPAEVALLKEQKHILNSKGEAETQEKNFQRFIPNLRFALDCFAKSHGFTFNLDISKVPLKEFEELRNRITHPKQLSDLTVTDEEIKKTEKVGQWFLDTTAQLMQQATKGSLPPRVPRVSPIARLNVTKDFIVIQPDGNVYQFDSLEEAQKYRDSQIVKDLPFMTPILFSTEDIRQGIIPRPQ